MAGRALPSLPQYRKDGVTRRLCASVHPDDDFAFEGRREALDRQLAWLGLSGLTGGHGSVAQVGLYGPLGILAACWWLVHRAQSQARAAAQQVFRQPEKAEKLAPPVEPEAEAWLQEHAYKRANVLPYADAAPSPTRSSAAAPRSRRRAPGSPSTSASPPRHRAAASCP